MANNSTMQSLLQCIVDGELLHGVLSSPWKKRADGPSKVSIRPVLIKSRQLYQVTTHYDQKVMHRNVTAEECAQLIAESLPEVFKQGIFSTATASYHVLVNAQQAMTIIHKASKQTAPLPLVHNRSKKYLLQEGVPIPFLIALGIMTAQGKVIAKKYDKFRQINRFVEMVSDVMSHLPQERAIEIIDFGCGKAYLTFALYHYLHHIAQRKAHILGLDLKHEVIAHCAKLAHDLGWSSLSFAVGDIHHHQPKGKVDLVISLHACDTATDAALDKAVQWDADVILCVPCCQHELYGQVKNESLSPLLRHGILKERFAALATDAARAELLTCQGYDVQVLEFIDMEHTPKNLLLRAVKGQAPHKQAQAKERYQHFKEALHISPFLESALHNHQKKWPKNFFDFSPIKDVQDIKALRKDLKGNLPEDPLA